MFLCYLKSVSLFFLNHNSNNRQLLDNVLTGSIPSELGMLSSLAFLYVSLLPHICFFSFVVLFLVFLNHNPNNRQLSHNDLTGSIPSELGMLSSLAILYVFCYLTSVFFLLLCCSLFFSTTIPTTDGLIAMISLV